MHCKDKKKKKKSASTPLRQMCICYDWAWVSGNSSIHPLRMLGIDKKAVILKVSLLPVPVCTFHQTNFPFPILGQYLALVSCKLRQELFFFSLSLSSFLSFCMTRISNNESKDTHSSIQQLFGIYACIITHTRTHTHTVFLLDTVTLKGTSNRHLIFYLKLKMM